MRWYRIDTYLLEKYLIDRVCSFLNIREVCVLEELPKFTVTFGIHLESYKDPTVSRTMIAIVKYADVLALTHFIEKIEQGTRALWKEKAIQLLVQTLATMAANHVTHVDLSKFVIGHIDDRKLSN